jgi:sugar phosphate isomerase/epimerase
MNYKRREFLKLSGNLATGLALAPIACKLMPKETGDIKPFGLQLYTLRDVLPKDPKGILKEVSLAGYKYVESYKHSELGMFWGMTNKDFKNYLEGIDLDIVSSHCDINKDFQKQVDDAAAIGMKYLICPSIDAQKTADDYKKFAAQLNQCGDICKKAGIKFGYHNHDHDFKVVDGQIAQDIYMLNTDPSLVDFEMDIYWVVTAKQDPEVWLKKYSNRFRLCHIKDRKKGSTEREVSVDLGTGSINFSKVLKTAKDNGMQYFIVEQERYDNSTPVQSIRVDAEYMKELKLKQ